MTSYRMRLLGQNGRLIELQNHQCAADHVALSLAFGLVRTCHAVEMWIGSRLIARVPHQRALPDGLARIAPRNLTIASLSLQEMKL